MVDQVRAHTPNASHGREERPSLHSGLGETRTCPDGNVRPLLVASTMLVVHGPTNEPLAPLYVVSAPPRNWLMRYWLKNGGTGTGVPLPLAKSSSAAA